MKKYLYPAAIGCTVLGFLILLLLMFTGVAYPHPFFTVGTLVGMGLIFTALFLWAVYWLMEMIRAVRGGKVLRILLLLLIALVCLYSFFRR
ncbi:hypothetical protein [Angelakisella massiliensis]|uniref:hypothetical protein n=1 Tax=Angelakisella massiliensis TaxID=1871018 RepID=UPI0008F8C2F1|nr:hypothetical protein [Angelakisella massiliensis]